MPCWNAQVLSLNFLRYLGLMKSFRMQLNRLTLVKFEINQLKNLHIDLDLIF